MPKTGVEKLGGSHHVARRHHWPGKWRVQKPGCYFKPIHHRIHREGHHSPTEVNRFITYAGPEPAFGPYPGTNTSLLLWHTAWNNVGDFGLCNDSYANYTAKLKAGTWCWKHHTNMEIHVNEPVSSVQILNASVRWLLISSNPGNVIDISNLVRGKYVDVHPPSRRQLVKMFSKK